MKKNKLYTMHKGMPAMFVDRRNNNIFDGILGGSSLSLGNGLSPDVLGGYKTTAPGTAPKVDWSNPVQRAAAVGTSAGLVNGFSGIANANSPFNQTSSSTNGLKNLFSSKNFSNGTLGAGLLSAGAGIIGGVVNRAISGDYSSNVGNTVSTLGNTAGGIISTFNPIAGAAVTFGSNLVGGAINGLFGTKVDEAKLKAVNEGIDKNNNFVSNAGSFDEIKGPEAIFTNTDVYSDGLLASGADEKNAELAKRVADSRQWVDRSINNNIFNLQNDQLNSALRNYAAFGGPIDSDGTGAINYDFMDRYLTAKEEQNKKKGTATLPAFMNRFAFGGDMQTNSADFSTGLIHIDEGGSHSENPNDGVQMGVDPEGTPNLVEEGETVWDDYVFSNRILADEATKQMFKLPKKKDITFADISKKLEKEISERPNDPISEAGFKAQMQTLEEQQERQKSEMEAKRARAAFEALSPEEQTAVMQNAAQQEQMAQQAAQEQAIAEQQAMQQPSPEEAAMMQQQMQADGSQAMIGQEAPMMAEGGHLYAEGSKIRKGVYKALGFHTDREFLDWARKHKLRGDDKWEMPEDWMENLATDDEAWKTLISDPTFLEAVKDNPALVHAIKNDYDFGAYSPSASGNITFDDDRGNWDAQTVQGWWGSNDPAWKQVIEAHPELTEDTNLSREQLADYLRNTDAFKRGTQWLQDSENNRLAYLQRIINNPNAPKRAKEYALRFADTNGWKQNAARDYETIFNNPSGRAANPGTYWKTPIEAVRGSQTGNFVINDDGTVEPIIGDVPTDWTGAGNYSWATPENDYAYNYYRRPAAADAAKTPEQKTPEQKADGTTKTAPPRHRAEWLRYAGLFGPAVGLGLQTMGIGRPDTSQLDAAISSSGNVTTADWKPLGNYLTYRPLDIWYEQNRANALSRATDRNVVNTAGGNRGTAMAGLLANGYNSQLASGNLFRQAQEYNDALRHKVADFNSGTDQFNAEAYNRNSQFNADAYNRARQFNAQMKLGAAREKMNADAGWYNGIYGNLAGLFKGISDIGRENAMFNMLADNAADGVYGNLGTSNTGKRWLKESKAKGGKLSKKKKGLTF